MSALILTNITIRVCNRLIKTGCTCMITIILLWASYTHTRTLNWSKSGGWLIIHHGLITGTIRYKRQYYYLLSIPQGVYLLKVCQIISIKTRRDSHHLKGNGLPPPLSPVHNSKTPLSNHFSKVQVCCHPYCGCWGGDRTRYTYYACLVLYYN